MRTIKEIMASLSRADLDALMTAFNEGIPYYVAHAPGRFIGVNTDAIPILICEQNAGLFREGRILEKANP